MVLSDQNIEKLVKEKNMITPYEEAHLQSVSYDITSGSYVQTFSKLNSAIDLRDNRILRLVNREINIEQGYLMTPGEYVLLKTKERFNIPETISAYVRPRTTFSRLGLIVHGQQLQPTFSGHLYLGVYNATPNAIQIFSGLLIAQIVFEKIDGSITDSRLYKNKEDAKYNNEDGFIAPHVEIPDSLRDEFNIQYRQLLAKLSEARNVE